MASFVIEELMTSPGATSIWTMPLTAPDRWRRRFP